MSTSMSNQSDHQLMDLVFIGAGKVATNLAVALTKAGHRVRQVYSRTEMSAKTLADKIEADYTTSVDEIVRGADIYFISITDSALAQLAGIITQGREEALFVHTAGSMSIDILPCPRRGVFYPMQTFSLERMVDFQHVPCFIEAKDADDAKMLHALACDLSDKVYSLSSHDRQYLHLAAVFCCNFSNHCYAIAEKMLADHGVPFSVMLPLIDETAAKAHVMSPVRGQTGPAARGDDNVMNHQQQLLADNPLWQQIYRLMSQDILNFQNFQNSHNSHNSHKLP